MDTPLVLCEARWRIFYENNYYFMKISHILLKYQIFHEHIAYSKELRFDGVEHMSCLFEFEFINVF